MSALDRLRYKCHTCSEWHEGLPNPGWDFPLPYSLVPESERSTRIILTSDFCIIDGKEFYVRASLELHIHGVDEPLSWGVWVSLSAASFRRYEELFGDQDRSPGESFFGWLCTPLPGYPEPQLLKARVHINPWPTRPLVELEPTEHPLAVDWRTGITVARALQLVAPFVAQLDEG